MVEACQIAAHSLTSNQSYNYIIREQEVIHRWKKTARSSINSLEHEIIAAVIVGVIKIGRQYLHDTAL